MDLHEGQTMSEAFPFISAGTAHTFTFNFQPDKVVFTNLTQWTSTAGGLPVSVYYRGLTTAAHAFQMQVIDSNAAQSFNFVDLATNGFTNADTSGGVATRKCTISAITQADPCNITHSAFTFQDDQIIRISDLGSSMPTARGMDELDSKRFKVKVVDSTHITLKDPISGEDIDSTAYTAYVSGGNITLETNVLQLNNPQVGDYATTPYVSNPYEYAPVVYKLTAGTSVMGSNDDQFIIEAFKYGQWTDLGDLLT